MFKRLLSTLLMVSWLISPSIHAKTPHKINITVEDGNWGTSPPPDIKAVCLSVIEAFPAPPPKLRHDIILRSSPEGPKVLYKRGPRKAYIVLLDTQNNRWAQLAFQFAHEYGHILSAYNDNPNPQSWLEESIAEVASLYALHQLTQSWKSDPPYPNWKSYAPHFKSYLEQRLSTLETLKQQNLHFNTWLNKELPSLEKNSTQRQKNLYIASQLLPTFQKHPQLWQHLHHINQHTTDSNTTLRKYLTKWYQATPSHLKKPLKSILQLLKPSP